MPSATMTGADRCVAVGRLYAEGALLMELDVYAPCPCGSGKKVKFCCAPILGDMAKVARLQAGDQPRQALQILEKLEKSHPNNPFVSSKHAEILIGLQQFGEA